MHRSLLLPAALALSLVSAVPAFARSPAEELGFSTKALERIKAAMAREIDKGTMPGAVTLIARDGEIVHFEAYGFLDAAKTKPMPKDAVFRAFSMTKPFVAVAAMMLVERGQLSLRDPVATYIPEMKAMTVLAEKTDASGKITAATINGHPATFGSNANTITGQHGYDEAGMVIRVVDTTPGVHTGEVGLKQGKAGQLNDLLGELTDAQDGPLHILDSNYDDITSMIDNKISYEQRRIATYAANLRKRFSKVDALLGTYDQMQTQLTAQVKQLSSSS